MGNILLIVIDILIIIVYVSFILYIGDQRRGDHMQLVEKWYGKFYLNEGGDVISDHIRDHDLPFDYHVIEVINKYIDSDSIIVDCGAYLGDGVVYFANRVREIIAFEPQKEIFELLVKNIELNNFDNVTAHNKGLYSENCFMHLASTQSSNMGAAVFGKSDGETEFEAITLDSLELPELDLIKIDCQGLDYQVLRGSVRTIERCRPAIIFEQESFSPDLIEKSLDLLYSLRYYVERISHHNDYLALPK